MPYSDIVPELREGLGISVAHDASILLGLKRNARFLLRNYNFRESLRKAEAVIAPLATTIAIPADAGKIKAVRLRLLSGSTYLYKRLRRREEGLLPRIDGPEFYSIDGTNIVLDTPMPNEAGYYSEVWYQTDDPTVAETWLSTKFSDVLEHRTGYELAIKKRKPEAATIYNPLWQEDMAVLAAYLQEIEFGDMDIRMGDELPHHQERYPSQ